MTIATQATAPTDPLSLRDGTEVEPGTTGPVQPRATILGGQVTEPIVTDGGTPSDTTPPTSNDLTVEQIHADAEGDERENLNDEYVVLKNSGDDSLDLAGWKIRDAAGQTYTVPNGVTVAPGETITLHTGSGTDTATDLYWGSGTPIWNNAGDTLTVTNSAGEEVLQESY
jgi:competence protein ComEC